MRGHSDPSAALLLGTIVGLWSFFKGFRVMREYRVLADTPRIPIRSVPMGFVHIRGKAQGTQILASPVSHTPCCFYRVEVDEWRSQGKGHNWVRACVDYNGYRFYLADDTGKILVDAHAAEYDLPAASTREVSSHTQSSSADADLLHYVQYAQTHSMTDRVSQFVDKRLAKAGPSADPQVQAKREALRDIFAGLSSVQRGGQPPIEAMERLMNASGPMSDPEKEQRRQMMLDRLHLAAQASQSGLLAALMPEQRPAEGRFRLREYLVLPDQEDGVDGSCLECSDPASDNHDRTMIAKGTNEPTFLISAKTDVQVHRAFRNRALLMIFGGAALALACTAGLLLHFGML
jgi:hypothetical protein